jgi:hypothetical protein
MLINSQGFSPITESGGLLVPGYLSRSKVKGMITADVARVRNGGLVERVSHGPNGVTNLGFNLMLDSTFRYGTATQYQYMYIGLISSSGWTGGGLQPTDTPASHANWGEDYTHYTPATYTGAVNFSGGYGGGTTTMAVDGVSQAIPGGTPFTVTGLSGTYVVTSSVGGATPTSVTFTPGLSGSAADNTVITFGNGRPIWIPSAATSKAITNPTSVNFPINTDNTVIKGIFVLSDPTLNGALGLMWSSGLFASDQTLFNGDVLKITYTVSLS